MKRFVTIVCIFTLIFGILPVSLSYLVDPFSVFHPMDVRDNGIEPNKNYVKMTYILNNPDRFNAYIFGSSRVGNIHPDKIWEYDVYNMTYSEATPQEILNNLKTLVACNVIPEVIYVGVDSLSYTIDPDAHLKDTISMPYEYAKANKDEFYKLYLDPEIVYNSLSIMVKYKKADEYMQDRFYNWGFNSDYDNFFTTYNFDNADACVGKSYRMDETLEEIQEIVDICKVNGIECIVFVNPMYITTYQGSLDLNFYEFLERLAEITPYVNFSGLNEITIDSYYWIDNSHFVAEVGDMMKECFCYNCYYPGLYEAGFGWHVTADNVHELIQILQNQ